MYTNYKCACYYTLHATDYSITCNPLALQSIIISSVIELNYGLRRCDELSSSILFNFYISVVISVMYYVMEYIVHGSKNQIDSSRVKSQTTNA